MRLAAPSKNEFIALDRDGEASEAVLEWLCKDDLQLQLRRIRREANCFALDGLANAVDAGLAARLDCIS